MDQTSLPQKQPHRNTVDAEHIDINAQIRQQDPFLFYSNPDNLSKSHSFELTYDSTSTIPPDDIQRFVRKTRISFEKDPLTLMLEDEELCSELEALHMEDGPPSMGGDAIEKMYQDLFPGEDNESAPQ